VWSKRRKRYFERWLRWQRRRHNLTIIADCNRATRKSTTVIGNECSWDKALVRVRRRLRRHNSIDSGVDLGRWNHRRFRGWWHPKRWGWLRWPTDRKIPETWWFVILIQGVEGNSPSRWRLLVNIEWDLGRKRIKRLYIPYKVSQRQKWSVLRSVSNRHLQTFLLFTSLPTMRKQTTRCPLHSPRCKTTKLRLRVLSRSGTIRE